MGYADWHFFWKDFEKNKGFRRIVLFVLVLVVGFFVWATFMLVGTDDRMQALEIIFEKHIMPKTLQDGYKVDNMDKAISEEIALLKEKQNPLYEDLVLMQQNYHRFLENKESEGKSCELEAAKRIDNKYLNEIDDLKKTEIKGQMGILKLKNPYHASIQSMIDISQGKMVDIELPLTDNFWECVKK